jgi:DNA segregation ATPase FtsK/SpoIIIE-like protein
MPKQYSEASTEVIHLAEDLISRFHPALEEARIAFVFQDEATETDGRIILGTTSKISPKLQPFMEFDFLIVIAEDQWVRMPSNAREALIDHELCHCGGDSLKGCKAHNHDIEEFYEVIQRHGVWKTDLFKLQSIMQLGLPGTEMIALPTKQGTVATLDGQQLALLSKNPLKTVTDFKDELLEEVRKFKAEEGEISVSKLQRKFKISYPRARSLMDLIETANGQ